MSDKKGPTDAPPGKPPAPGPPGKPPAPGPPRKSSTPTTDAPADEGNRRVYTHVASGAAAESYDFVTPRHNVHTTTVMQSVAHLVKSCLGGGVVSIHATYAKCGLWFAVILNVVLGVLVAHLMIVLAKSAQKVYGRAHVNSLSYPEVAEATLQISKHEKIRKWSRCFRYAVDATIMIDLFGSCCCYMCLIAEQWSQLFEYYFSIHMSLRIYVALLILPCIAICMILTLKYLAPFSIVADVVIVLVAITTVVYGTWNATSLNRSPFSMPFWKKNIPDTFQFMGGCVFSMEGVGVTLPIENSMQDPRKISLVLSLGMGIVIGIVMTVGFFGYWGWADLAKAPVTTNFPMNMLTLVLKITLPLMIYVTFALNFWVPFNLAWVYLKNRNAGMDMKLKERLYRAIFVILVSLIAIAFPQVVTLMGVIGAFCLSNMGFLYPAFIELLLDWEEPGLGVMKWRLIKFIAIAIFAAILMVVGTISGVVDLISKL